MLFKKIQSDGFKNSLTNLFNKIYSYFYRTTYTLMLKGDLSYNYIHDLNNIREIVLAEIDDNYILNLPTLKFKNWENNGSRIFFFESNGSIEGYVVIHTVNYHVDGLGDLDLKEKRAAWIGPIFVHINKRGRGINKALISCALKFCIDNNLVPYTSTNINNLPSIRTFENFGFKVVQIFRCRYIFKKSKITKVFKNDV